MTDNDVQLLTRMAWFMVANDIAGSISGLLGAGLGSLQGLGGYSGWSWIFFIEGLMTVVVAAMAFFWVLPFPHESNFLPPEEKAWLMRKLAADGQQSSSKHEHMTFRGAMRALKDWRILVPGYLYLSVCITAYSISVFSPTILHKRARRETCSETQPQSRFHCRVCASWSGSSGGAPSLRRRMWRLRFARCSTRGTSP